MADERDRAICLVPACDEPPDTGQVLCPWHQQACDREVAAWREAIRAYEAGDPFPVLEMFDEE